MKAKGWSAIAAVFRQIEMHAPDQVPGRVQCGQEALQSGLGGGERRGEGLRHLIPQRQQDILGQIFGPRHHRRGQHQRGEFGSGWRRYDSADFGAPPLPCRTRADKATRRKGLRSHATRRTPGAMPARPRPRPAAPARIRSREQTRRSGELMPRRRCPTRHPVPRR